MLVCGDPGIGKTRMAEELARTVAAAGMRPLWGRCIEGEGAPPFWPWIQIIDAYARAQSATDLRADLGSAATAIAQLAPGIAARLPDLPPPASLEPDAARFRLFDGITAFLGRVAAHAASGTG